MIKYIAICTDYENIVRIIREDYDELMEEIDKLGLDVMDVQEVDF